MRAEQSKFMASMNSNLEEQMDGSQFEPEVCTSEEARDIEVPAQYVCSLCHDSNSKNPVSFLVLLQVTDNYCLFLVGCFVWVIKFLAVYALFRSPFWVTFCLIKMMKLFIFMGSNYLTCTNFPE